MKRLLAAFAAIGLFLTLTAEGCGPSGVPMPSGDIAGWHQVLADDFTGTTLSSCWGKYTGIAGSSDTLWDPSHVTVHDGVADIDTYNDSSDGRWASGGMSSAPCLKQRYGRYEIRFKMTKATGVKYAILMWPSTAPWPCGGEIDFAEDSGGNRDHTTLTVHYCDANGDDALLPQQHVSADFSTWQTIGIEWTAGNLVWLLNGTPVGGYTNTHIPATVMEFDVQNETVGVDGTTPAHVHMLTDWAVAYSAA